MNNLKAETLIGIILIVVLGFYGWLLSERITAAGRPPDRAHTLADANQRFVFRSESGVAISGELISPFFPAGTKSVMVFMLRGESVRTDLDFWRQVATLLPKNETIRLIGYCDGDKCRNSIRGGLSQPNFPVIAYGEVGAAQALLNADAKGDFLLLLGQEKLPNGKIYKLKNVRWRAAGQTPSNVIETTSQ